MSAPSLVPPGGGEVIGDSADRRVEIVSDVDSLHATWSRFGPGRDGADLHVHRHHTDLFFVLAGELTLRLGADGEPAIMPAGTLARVPPLVVHGFRNGSEQDVCYLNLHAPGRGFADYLRAMRDRRSLGYDQHEPPPDGGRPTTEAVIGGDGFRTGRPGLSMTLLADVEAIALTAVCSEPGAPSPAEHVHHRHVESLYVLEGELVLSTGRRTLRGEAGTWLQVPPGLPHTLSFPGSRPARFLELHTPSSVAQPAADRTRPARTASSSAP